MTKDELDAVSEKIIGAAYRTQMNADEFFKKGDL